MFNNIFSKIQRGLIFLYDNSLFLQKIDFFILLSILAVILISVFSPSDYIGFMAIVTIFLTFIKLLTKPDEKLALNKFELFLLAYFMLVFISLAGSTLFSLSLKGFFKTCIYIGFYFSFAHYIKNNNEKLPLIFTTLAGCVCFESIIALLQNFYHVEAISTWQDTSRLNPEQVMTRVYGTLKPYNPNLFGGYLIATIPALFGTCAYNFVKNNYKRAVFFFIFSVPATIAVFLTGCRGAYLALLAIFACLFVISAKFLWQKYKKIYLFLIASCVSAFTFLLITMASLRARFASIFAMRNDSSNSFRFNVYQSCIEMFKDNWLLGIGVGNKNFREIYGLYMKTGFDALSAYNIFLEIAVESGIFALVAFLGFLFVCVKKAIEIIVTITEKEKIIFVSMALISIIALILHGLVDTVFFRPQIHFVFFIMVGVISGYEKIISNKIIE